MNLVWSFTTQIMNQSRSRWDTSTQWDKLGRVSTMNYRPMRRVSLFLRRILRTRLREGYKCVNGRLAKIQKTARDQTVHWPEAWLKMQETQRKSTCILGKKETTEESTRCWPMTKITSRWLLLLVWNRKRTLLLLCGALRRMTAENLRQLQLPLMPVRNNQIQKIQEHAGKWSDNVWTTSPKKGDVGSFHNGLVHKEWNKWKTVPAWDVEKMRPKSEVSRPANKAGKSVHFAKLMDLCHLENAELAKHFQKNKGESSGGQRQKTKRKREQHSQGKVLQRRKRQRQSSWTLLQKLPGRAGETSDAIPAYAQVNMNEGPRLLRLPREECLDIWIIIPPRQWPEGWNNIGDPVVPLERLLYGHPLTDLLWERKFE